MDLKKSVFSSIFWKFCERILAQLISFCISIYLARLLSPNDYGIVAMGMIFINIANVFVSNGFSAALIQKKDADEIEFSTLFYCSLLLSIILYFTLFFIAPVIANFYDNYLLVKLVRIFALILPLTSYKSIQQAYVSKTLDFKKFFFSTLAGTITSGIVGIILAKKGFGVWALVGQYFTNNIIDTIVLTFSIKWKPKLLFSFNKAKPLLNFGYKVLGSSLIGTLYNQLNYIIIGRKYTSSDLAYYTKGSQFPNLISNNISSTLVSVLFPAFSIKSDKIDEMKNMCKRAISVSSFILLPFYFGLMAISTNVVEILLTDKWIQCIPFIIIMSINGIIGTIDIIDLQILKAMGRSDTNLKLEFIKKPLYIIITFIALKYNIFILALTVPFSSIIAIIINSSFVNKYLGYSLGEKIKDIFKSFISALLMFICIFIMNYIKMNKLFVLILQIIIGIVLYISFAIILKNENFTYCLELLNIHVKKQDKSIEKT